MHTCLLHQWTHCWSDWYRDLLLTSIRRIRYVSRMCISGNYSCAGYWREQSRYTFLIYANRIFFLRNITPRGSTTIWVVSTIDYLFILEGRKLFGNHRCRLGVNMKVILMHTMKTHEEWSYMAVLIPKFGTRWRWFVRFSLWPLYFRRKMLDGIKEVKVTLVQALRLCTDRTVHRRSRGIALPFRDHGTRWRWFVRFSLWPLYLRRKMLDGIKKVKVTLVQALRLCTDRAVHRGSRGIALPFRDHGTRRGWGVSVTSRPLFTPGKDQVHTVQEAGWAPGPLWTGAENLASTGIRSPDRLARSQSLYRLRYPAHGWY